MWKKNNSLNEENSCPIGEICHSREHNLTPRNLNLPDQKRDNFLFVEKENQEISKISQYINRVREELASILGHFKFSSEDDGIFHTLCEKIIEENPSKYVCPVLFFLFVQYRFDYYLDVSKICECLNLNIPIFYKALRTYLCSFFDFDDYQDKVYKFIDIYIKKIKSSELRILENIKEDFIDNKSNYKSLFEQAIKNKFSPINIGENSRIDFAYFFPQYTALTLLYAHLKSNYDTAEKIGADIFHILFKEEPSWASLPITIPTLLANRNKNLLLQSLEINFIRKRPNDQIVLDDIDEFISTLNQIKEKNKNNELEIQMLIDLFKLLNGSITPNLFIKQLDFTYRPTLAHCLEVLKGNNAFRYNRLLKIKNNLSKLFKDEKSLLQAIECVDKIINARILYSRDNFICLLQEEQEREEVAFLLKLYQMTSNMTPYDFVRELNIYSGDINALIRAVVRDKGQFLEKKTFDSFRRFINNNISNQIDKENILKLLENLQRVRSPISRDYGVNYRFSYIPERINQIFREDLRKVLGNYFSDVCSSSILDEVFGSRQSLRISNFKIVGFNFDRIDYHIIKEFFFNKIVFQKDYNFIPINNWKYKIDFHNELEAYFLQNDGRFLAKEIPLFMKIMDLNYKFLTGHIDIIFFQNNLIVCDIKNDEQEIYKSIPQLMTYGVAFQKILRNYGSNVEIKCLGIAPNLSLEFDTNVMQKEILSFLDYLKKDHNDILVKGSMGKAIRLKDVIEKTIFLINK